MKSVEGMSTKRKERRKNNAGEWQRRKNKNNKI